MAKTDEPQDDRRLLAARALQGLREHAETTLELWQGSLRTDPMPAMEWGTLGAIMAITMLEACRLAIGVLESRDVPFLQSYVLTMCATHARNPGSGIGALGPVFTVYRAAAWSAIHDQIRDL